VLSEYFERIRKEQEEQQKLLRAEAKNAGDLYLKTNANGDGVEVTSSGLQYKVITKADGESKHPNAHSRVKCHYEGRLITGDVFDSSYQRGEPVVFGLDQVIQGWIEGLQLMSVGDKYEFTIPSELAYGENGVPGRIPGNSVLIFTVELLEIL
jgi:FKBP-type peptidyl-prolyl cis-trans isomerase